MARELVPGDVVLIKSGDRIPADCRLVQSADLFVDESRYRQDRTHRNTHTPHITYCITYHTTYSRCRETNLPFLLSVFL